MAVREFNGTSDLLVVDNGALSDFNVAGNGNSLIVVVNPLTIGTDDAFISVRSGDPLTQGSIYAPSAATINTSYGYDGSGDSTAIVNLSDHAWQILAIDKPAGTGLPRHHRKALGSGSWSHVNGNLSIVPATSGTVQIIFGSFEGASGFMNMRLACAAIFNRQLSDAEYESIDTSPSTATINGLGPVCLWDFNQASTATNVLDLTSGNANQTNISGTTVVTTDDPPGWTFGITQASFDPDELLQAHAGRFGPF